MSLNDFFLLLGEKDVLLYQRDREIARLDALLVKLREEKQPQSQSPDVPQQ